MAERGLANELVERTLTAPQQIVPGFGATVAYQSQIDFEGKAYLLRVIVTIKGDSATVVTAYRTSKIYKYWRVS